MCCAYLQVARIVRGRTFVLVDLAVPPGESLVACARVALDGIETAPADSTRVGGTIIVVMGGGGGRYNRTTICARSDSPVNQVLQGLVVGQAQKAFTLERAKQTRPAQLELSP